MNERNLLQDEQNRVQIRVCTHCPRHWTPPNRRYRRACAIIGLTHYLFCTGKSIDRPRRSSSPTFQRKSGLFNEPVAMSSEEDYQDGLDDGQLNGSEDPKAKKRRVQRACDICRRKKSAHEPRLDLIH